MAHPQREAAKAVEVVLAEAGAKLTSISTAGSGNQKAEFTVDGVAGVYFFPCSPSRNPRSRKNITATLRRHIREMRSGRKVAR